MRSSESRLYAEQCAQMAREAAPAHAALLLDLARKWCDAAADLEMHEKRSDEAALYNGSGSQL